MRFVRWGGSFVALAACVACSMLTDLDGLHAPTDASVAPDTSVFDTSTPADASVNDQFVADSADAVVSTICAYDKAFGAPTPIAELNTSSLEEFGRLSPDEKTIYFNSTRSGKHLLYAATRATRNDVFGAPTPLSSLNSSSKMDGDTAITVSSDGLVAFYARTTQTGQLTFTTSILTASRANTLSPFGAPTPAANLNGVTYRDTPNLALDDSELWLIYSNASYGVLGRATQSGQGFATPVGVPELGNGSDNAPVLASDKLTLYFSRTNTIVMSHRAKSTSSWGVPTAVGELNGGGASFPTWISPDGCRLYLFSDRGGNEDLYVAKRMP